MPMMRPMSALAAMANPPPASTRMAPRTREAPPSEAPSAPSTTSATSETAATVPTACPAGATAKPTIGQIASDEKLPAETSAACSGRARWASCSPSSSRRWVFSRSRRAQLLRDLLRQVPLEAALDIDVDELGHLELRVLLQLAAFDLDVRLFDVALRADRDVLAGGHGQRPGGQPRDAGDHHRAAGHRGRRDADDQAGGRDDAVVRAQDRPRAANRPGRSGVLVAVSRGQCRTVARRLATRIVAETIPARRPGPAGSRHRG